MQFAHHALQVGGETSNQRRIMVTSFDADRPSGAGVMIIGGLNSVRQKYARYAMEIADQLQMNCLTIDLSGHGESGAKDSRPLGQITPREHTEEAVACYDFLENIPRVSADRIGVVGASYGGRIAMLLSGLRTPKSLLLRAPAVDELLPEALRRQSVDSIDPVYRDLFLDSLATESPLMPLSKFDGSVTIIESEIDNQVSAQTIKACLIAARHPHHILMRGAEHSLKDNERPAFEKMVLDWAAEL